MSYYDAPPLRSHRDRGSRRDSFDAPPLRHNAAFYPQESTSHRAPPPQSHNTYEPSRYTDPYPHGSRRDIFTDSPFQSNSYFRDFPRSSPSSNPRVFHASPTRSRFPEREFNDEEYDRYDRYEHSPPGSPIRSRSPSPPPAFYSKPDSYHDTSYERAQARGRGRERARDAGQYGRNGNGEGDGARYWDSEIPSSRSQAPPPPPFQPSPFQQNAYFSRPQDQSQSHSSSNSYPRPQPQPQPEPERNASPLPHNPVTDTSPAAYTYDDEEPDTIPIQPAAWNKHTSSATKEELISYFVSRGVHPTRAAAAVDREFSAHAPQWIAGQRAGRSRAEERRWDEENREERSSSPRPRPEPNFWGQGSSRRHHSPPPSAFRSPNPGFEQSRQRSSSSSSRARYQDPSTGQGSGWERRR
ncbi:hypothetical protein VTL71DRAFT_6377 [Oculimacula yallundae]|uniref:Uncharacterized protein n=1 Tax=Oculimacula yallundae TaxID=86028 RepID=A0ABR4BWV1_9HELO